MKKITKKELYEMLDRYCKERLNSDSEYHNICINSFTIYFDKYSFMELEDGDFSLSIYLNGEYISAYRSYEMEYIYLDFTMYQII